MELSDKAILKLGDLLWAIKNESALMEREAESASTGRVEMLVGIGVRVSRIKSQAEALYGWYERVRPDNPPLGTHENPLFLG